MKKRPLLTCKLFLVLILTVNISIAQEWVQKEQLLPDSVEFVFDQQRFGSSIAIHNDYAAIGAKNDNSKRGKVLVYHFDGSSWNYEATLLASDAAENDYLGTVVDMYDNVIIVSSDKGSGAVYIYTKSETGWQNSTETAKLSASDGISSDGFANSLAISEDIIAVGASDDDDNGDGSGSVYLYKMPATGWETATETVKLTAVDGMEYDAFGRSLDIHDKKLVVSAYALSNSSVGRVYVYELPETDLSLTSISEKAKLTAAVGDASNGFGTCVSMSENTIVVGDVYDDMNGSSSGAIYVFEKPVGGSWSNSNETAKLTPSNSAANQYFGSVLSCIDNQIVVGSYNYLVNGIKTGGAYVFEKTGTEWSNNETAILQASDGADGDYFGQSVAISGKTVLIGAVTNDEGGENSGAVYAFNRPESGWNASYENEKMLPHGTAVIDELNYGNAVAMHGNYAVVGSKKYNTVTVLRNNGTRWVKIAELKPSDGGTDNLFGCSVDITDNCIVIGSRLHDNGLANSGAAYVFVKPEIGWVNATETAKLTASDAAQYDEFGNAVSISGNTIVVGSSKDDDNGSKSGSAYVFVKPSTGWSDMTETAKLLPSDGAKDYQFGYSVDIDGDEIVVGKFYDEYYSSADNIYVYSMPQSGWADMTETAKLTCSEEEQYHYHPNFGIKVKIHNGIIISSATREQQGEKGTVFLYEKPATGWVDATENATLKCSKIGTQSDFGSSIAITDDMIIVGTQKYGNANMDFEPSQGAVFVYVKPTTGWATMTETQRIVSSDAASYHYFGCSVSASGNAFLVGAYANDTICKDGGSVYYFTPALEVESYDEIIACDSYTWIDDITYTSNNNTATVILQAESGRDSIVGLNLTIANNSGIDVVQACDTYTWINGITYTESNFTDTHTLTNQYGCDSVVTLNLFISHSNSGTDVIQSCDSFTWIDGVTYTESNNSATYTLVNENGCDSIVTLNLTITTSDEVTQEVASCGAYTWINGITYTESNNSATYLLKNQQGCDSLITLNLTVYKNNSTDVIEACDSYTWIDGITYTESNSTATYTIDDGSGCDSEVMLDLTINKSSSSLQEIIANNSYVWIDGVTYNESTDKPTFVMNNFVGCDSVINLSLTVLHTLKLDSIVTLGNELLDSNASTNTVAITNLQNAVSSALGEHSTQAEIDNLVNEIEETIEAYRLSIQTALPVLHADCEIYPTISMGKFYISSSSSKIIRIDVLNSTGNNIHSLNINSQSANLDISNYTSGLYKIKIVTEKDILFENIIKQ